MNGYFDHNATTPLSPAAREAWLDAQVEAWQNPSGLYRTAAAVKRRLEEAREAFAALFGCDPDRVVFNSGATEGANAVMGALSRGGCGRPPTAFVSAIEHPCVTQAAKKWFGPGSVRMLPVDSSGVLDLDVAKRLVVNESPSVVSVMAAHNETGVIQPWRELAAFCRELGVPFHCDAAQWAGKEPVSELGQCDWVSLSGHKFGGPKGVGLLIVPAGLRGPLALQAGGPQEGGHRGGTEDYPGIAAMLAALRCSRAGNPAGRDAFERAVLTAMPEARVVGAGAPRIFNTSMLVVPGAPNLKWLTRLGERGFAVSTGSACSAGHGNPSAAMAAMGMDPKEMSRVLRFSGGADTEIEDWLALAAAVVETMAALGRGERATARIDLTRL